MTSMKPELGKGAATTGLARSGPAGAGLTGAGLTDAVPADAGPTDATGIERAMRSTSPDPNRDSFLNMVAEKLGRQRRRPWDVVHPDFGPHPAEDRNGREGRYEGGRGEPAGQHTRLSEPHPAESEQTVPEQTGPHPAGPEQTEDLVTRFIRVFESQKGHAVRVHGAGGVRHALSDIIRASRVKRAVVWDDDRIDQFGVLDYLAGQGVAAHRWPGDGEGRHTEREDTRADRGAWAKIAESSQIGITWADGVCAETGTILLQNHAGHGRLVSLLPRHHVAIFEARQIVPRLTGLMAELHRLAEEDALPAYTNFIAGPSGSADIAMEYIQGVHGPGTVTAIIVEEEV
ncbi:LutC/YkgG family protein [Alicyclobacillus ferrooxydans]|uniref:LutC/YkgG family protein n=1 Tax=Alicyclobacillus ferrooxydans TaxID=471514 RepID=UPI0006D52FC1|nr:lactate utilization protein [Alicyclobacillus ferrooxydans]